MEVPATKNVVMSAAVVLAFAGAAAAQPPEQPQTLPSQAQAPDYYAEAQLDGLIRRALDQHPGLDEVRLRHEAAIERIAQVQALPEPVFGYMQAVRATETRVGPLLNTFSISQSIPWFGTLDLKAEVARANAGAVGERVGVLQRDIIFKVKQAYYELAYVDDALRTTDQERLLLEQYEGLAQSRYAAGLGPLQAVVKLQAEITRVLSRRETLFQQRAVWAARLNTLMDDPPASAIPEIDPLEVPVVTPERDALVQLGDLNRPELRSIEAVEATRERALDLAGISGRPNFMIGASYGNILQRRDPMGTAQPPDQNGKNPLALSFNLTIPIRRAKYDAAIRQAGRDLAAEQSRHRTEQNRMALEIEEQLARLRTLAEQTTLFERALVPQAEEALRSAEAAYATGQATVLDLLDSERILLEVRLVLARQRSDRLIAMATLERAIGTRFPNN